MAKLHCCLTGFNGDDASQIEEVVGLVREYLSDDWSVSTATPGTCDLLLCDVDSVAGADAWQDSGRQGVPRAAASSEALPGGGLTLSKPLRVHGPGGLVHVLNEAAQLAAALADPNRQGHDRTPPEPPKAFGSAPPPQKRGGLRSIIRSLPGWLSGQLARPSVPAAYSRPHDVRPAVEASRQPSPTGTAVMEMDLPPDATQEPGPVEPGMALATTALAHPTPASPASIVAQGTVPADVRGHGLLELLQRATTASQVIVVRMDGVPAICAAPANGMAYTFATLQAIYGSPRAAFWTDRVTIAQNSYYGRTEVLPDPEGPPVSVPGLPIKNLLWVAMLRCGGAHEAAPFRNGTFKLLSWPDLAGLPHARHHVSWCGLLARRPMTAAALAGKTSHDAEEAAVFMAACHELGIIQQKELAADPAPDQPVPARQASERITVLRGILSRLGLQHP